MSLFQIWRYQQRSPLLSILRLGCCCFGICRDHKNEHVKTFRDIIRTPSITISPDEDIK